MKPLICCLLPLLISLLPGISACRGQAVTSFSEPDTAKNIHISRFFENKTVPLGFPKLVQKFYEANHNQPVWTGSEINTQKLWDALFTLDCVLQYGLNPADYHPGTLTYDNWRQVLSDSLHKNPQQGALLDVLLTDAVLKFIAHLHFGKQNPHVPVAKLDDVNYPGYRIDSVLKHALQPAVNLKTTLLSAQPKNRGYQLLQDFLRLMTFQYTGDCYEVPADTLRLIARNLERYKWNTVDDSIYIEINIPSFTLNYIRGEEILPFKIIVGKPSTPTPLLNSEIRFFTTAPDWTVPLSIFKKELLPKALADTTYLDRNNFALYNRKGQLLEASRENLRAAAANPSAYFARQSAGCDNALGRIVFNFENPYSVYLHDTPNPSLFKQANRALSHGCIRVENPEKLVSLLLNEDNAPSELYPKVIHSMNAYRRFRYNFKKPVPVTIRYITCEVKNGELVQYPDLYKKDTKTAGF